MAITRTPEVTKEIKSGQKLQGMKWQQLQTTARHTNESDAGKIKNKK